MAEVVTQQAAATMTAAEFEAWALQPENAERRLELVAGEVVPVVSNNYASAVAARILIRLGAYVEAHDLGYITGADGGYCVGEDRYIPDVAYISKQRQPQPSHEAYNPQPPDLAVEVLSPSDDPRIVRRKVANYLAAGVTVWLVLPEERAVEVYAPGQPVQTLGEKDTLQGGELLPEFSLPVKDIFPK